MISRILKHIPLITNKTKILISATLVIFSFILCFVRPNNIDSKICIIAMCISFIGDFTLNCMPLNRRPTYVLYIGAFFFMTSHLIYATAYHLMLSIAQKSFLNTGAYLAYFFMVTIFVVSIISIIHSKKTLKLSMFLVFTMYFFIISINFITICSYSWSFNALSFIGALSFLISDYIIGIETVFKIKSDNLRKLVWIFYPIGQFLILACR